MMRGMWASATGMKAQQLNIDTIANNLANVNTPGFKRSQATFQDLLYDQLKTPGAKTGGDSGSTGMQMGLGTRMISVEKVYTSGRPQQTENQFDLMIQGKGFFKVSLPDGTAAYTRDGSFHLDEQSRLVTADGNLLDGMPTMNANATAVSVSPNGTVSETVSGTTTELGQIPLYSFVNPAGMISVGQNLLVPSSASGDATQATAGQDGLGTIQQGMLELSNVEVVQEMVNLIVAQRAYEVNVKAIQASDEMLQSANNIRR